MKPLFQLCPVEHLEASVDYYRELGLRPLDWPDDETVLLGPDTTGEPTIALVRDPQESALSAGGVFDAGDVDAFYAAHPELDWLVPPTDRSFGRYAVFADRTGTAIRLLDPLHRRAGVLDLAVAS
jgi:catechol 2,3-dioxygenase-like lactoylglutathione lyase family enzyme